MPCQDLFGSNAYPEGGAFGRIDAGYTSIEAQNSTGSLHAHSQLFVQCVHQHTPLHEILAHLRTTRAHTVIDYLKYKAHVCRQEYAAPPDEETLEGIEKNWPEYKKSAHMIAQPACLKARVEAACRTGGTPAEGAEWLANYLDVDVQRLQERKQNHVHVRNPDTGEREPLQACRRKDNPKLCKGEFPRPWLIDKAVVLCRGLIKKMRMHLGGRRSKLGAMHGPMNQESLNGTHPAMLAAQRCNSDVQLPYRFPITEETHMGCSEECIGDPKNEDVIVRAAQVAQDAQAGYACDY